MTFGPSSQFHFVYQTSNLVVPLHSFPETNAHGRGTGISITVTTVERDHLHGAAAGCCVMMRVAGKGALKKLMPQELAGIN
jgi:hypothetical protein